MEGRATFTIVTSRPTMSRLIEQMRRIPIRRVLLSSWIAGGIAEGEDEPDSCVFITIPVIPDSCVFATI
jgi:hypothetical protein